MQDQELLGAVLEMKSDVGYIKGTVDSINEQTKKTNGRVTRAEKRINYIVLCLAVLVTALFILNPQLQEIIKAIIKL